MPTCAVATSFENLGSLIPDDVAFTEEAEEAEASSSAAPVDRGVAEANAELDTQFLETQSYSHTS